MLSFEPILAQVDLGRVNGNKDFRKNCHNDLYKLDKNTKQIGIK